MDDPRTLTGTKFAGLSTNLRSEKSDLSTRCCKHLIIVGMSAARHQYVDWQQIDGANEPAVA